MSVKLITAAQAREKLGGICEMTMWRRRQAVPPKLIFPKPICINGRNYFYDHELDEWVLAHVETVVPTQIIPNAEEGRANGREKLSALRAAQNQPIDQLGHNGGPPIDDAVEQDGPPVIQAGIKVRGGENG